MRPHDSSRDGVFTPRLRPRPGPRLGPRLKRFLRVNACLAVVAWTLWLVLGGTAALSALADNWLIALTMIPGSLVGGGTSEGGGAVAFPVLTKLLAVPADTARIFTFAIQSVGMTAASISILVNRVPVERRTLLWGIPSGVVGAVLSIVAVADHLDQRSIRVAFTVLVTALAIALLVQRLQGIPTRAAEISRWHDRERLIVVSASFVGGFLSGLAGVGVDTVMFIFLVLLFGVSEKVATPTTVVMMAAVSVAAFGTHVWVVDSFQGPVVGYWLAAAPIVVVGAPLGAWICTKMSPAFIRWLLIVLITVELVSTILLVPLGPVTAAVGGAALAACLVLCLMLTRVTLYRFPPVPDSPLLDGPDLRVAAR